MKLEIDIPDEMLDNDILDANIFIEDGKVNNVHIEPRAVETGHCKDCKWWKDSDGTYRRGVRAESICPINTKTVLDGNGYCYLFKAKD